MDRSSEARFEEQLGSEFKLEKFPFDQQLLRIYVQSFTWDQSIVRLVNLGDVVSLSRNSRLPSGKKPSICDQKSR